MLFFLLHSTNQTIVSICLLMIYIDMIYYIYYTIGYVSSGLYTGKIYIQKFIFQEMKSNLDAVNLWHSI